jgi:hypothetical protein
MKNLPIAVQDWEWDAEQARRLVDVARHAWRGGGHWRGVRLLGRALSTSPRGAMGEIQRRLKAKAVPKRAKTAGSPAEGGIS